MNKEAAQQKLKNIQKNSAPASTTPQQEVAQRMAESVKGPGFSSFLRSFFSNEPSSSVPASVPIVFGLKEINKILQGCVVAVFIFLLVDLLNGIRYFQSNLDYRVDSRVSNAPANWLPRTRQLATYLAPIEARNIFQPIEKKAVEATTVVPENGTKIVRMTEKMKLVGVSWLDSPETASVMIEDQENGMTYFAHQGEKVKELTVKIIYVDRAVLTYQDEEITIKL